MLNKITSPENSKKKSFIPTQNIGLYTDNNLIQKIMESIITTYDDENLKIEFKGKSKMKCTNYLDVK